MLTELIEITDENFQKEVVDNDGVVLVDFYAQWCGPCKVLSKTMEELREEYPEDVVKICKADIEVNSMTVKELNISSVPLIAIYKDGKFLNKHVGLRSKQDIQNDLNEAFD